MRRCNGSPTPIQKKNRRTVSHADANRNGRIVGKDDVGLRTSPGRLPSPTNDRGANFSSKPYFFMQTSLVGGGDWLNIVVQFIGSGALKGGSVKARSGVLDGTVSDAFKALVAQTLAKVER